MRRTIIMLIAMLYCCGATARVQPGDTPPDALGSTFGGNPVSLATLHGKVVVISFWASWCGYCMQELPVLAKLQLVAAERKLPLQVVSVNYREDHDTFLRTARLLRKRLPSLMLSWDRDGHVGKPYGTSGGIPVMVMLHRRTGAHRLWRGHARQPAGGDQRAAARTGTGGRRPRPLNSAAAAA